MGVIVNKARRHDQPGCVDFLAAGAKHAADIGDLAVLDRDVADERRHPRPIDNPTATYNDVVNRLVHHSILSAFIIRALFPYLRMSASLCLKG